MQVFVYKNAEEVARAAATVFAAEIFKKPDCVLGLATGSTRCRSTRSWPA